MNNKKPSQTDWVHLAADVEVRYLWDPLHDSTLVSCQSDLLARTVTLRFASAHLVPGNPSAAFDFVLSEVTSSRATIQVRWPGGCVLPEGLSREEQEPLIHEYWSKWREVSFGWTDFESALRKNTFLVADVYLAIRPPTRALKIGGFLNGGTIDDLFCEVFIAFKALSIRGSDGAELSLDEFEQLGIDYWEAFAKRPKQ